MTGTSSLDEPERVKLQLAVGRSVNTGFVLRKKGRSRVGVITHPWSMLGGHQTVD